MAERLSYRMVEKLVDYMNDFVLLYQQGVGRDLEAKAFADEQMKLLEQWKEAAQKEYYTITNAEKERMLQRSQKLSRELDLLSDMAKLMEQVYPRYKVNFTHLPKPKPITDLVAYVDHLENTFKRIKDGGFVNSLQKAFGVNGWKTNNDAAGEIWLQLDQAKAVREKEQDDLMPAFQKFCNAEAAKQKKKENAFGAELTAKFSAKTAENKKLEAQAQKQKAKLMGDPRVRELEEQLRAVGPMLGKPEGWQSYTPATQLPSELLMARSLNLTSQLHEYTWHPDSKLTPEEYLDPVGRQFSFYNPKAHGFVLPETFLVDYYLILWAETDDDVSGPAGLFRDIVLRQMRFMPLKSTRSFFIDPKGLGKNMKRLIKLTKEQGGSGVCTLVTQGDDIAATMAQLREHVTKARQTLTVSGCVDTTVYNAQAAAKDQIPYTTLVIHDFPYGFSGQALDDLHTVLNQANACGFTILISRSKNDPIDGTAKELFYNCDKGRRLEYRGEKCVMFDGDFKLPLRRMEVEPSDLFLEQYNRAYSYRPPVRNGFFDHMDEAYMAKPFAGSSAKEIRIPFAVDGEGKVQELVLDSDLKSYGLIIGGTGAGKTSLLHTIINSAALHYSPQELEMWLIDYKLTSFNFYRTNPLPQIRHIVMDESDVLTYSVVDELLTEYAYRQRLFKEAGVKDFGDYRKKGLHLPRLLVLVDETHLMSQALSDEPEYKLHMQNIIAQARYTGINILFSDQKYSALGGFSESCKGDMYVRITLKNTIEQVKDTLGLYNMSTVSQEVAKAVHSMPAATAGTMIYKHEERDPDDNKTKRVYYDHISCLYAPTDAFCASIEAVSKKTDGTHWPCEVYEGAVRLTYSEQAIARYEKRKPIKLNEGDRFYIGSPCGMGKCFSFSLKQEDEGENLLLVGNQGELSGPLVANCIRNALRHDYHVVVLVPRASMFYKKNKPLVWKLAEEFGRQVEFYTEYSEICRFIGLKANVLKSLDQEDWEEMPDPERLFMVCLGADDLYKKMEDDTNTQKTAWAALQEEPPVQTQKAESEKAAASHKTIDLQALIDGANQRICELDELENARKKPGRFAASVEQLKQVVGDDMQTDGFHTEPAGAEAMPFPATAPKSIGNTQGLLGYNAIADLFVTIRDGWKLGYHTLLAVNSTNGLKNMPKIKLGGNFNHRIALPMAPEQGGAFLYNTKALKNMANENDYIGAVYEYMGGNGQRFIPYDEA